jgi:hypothetical protein
VRLRVLPALLLLSGAASAQPLVLRGLPLPVGTQLDCRSVTALEGTVVFGVGEFKVEGTVSRWSEGASALEVLASDGHAPTAIRFTFVRDTSSMRTEVPGFPATESGEAGLLPGTSLLLQRADGRWRWAGGQTAPPPAEAETWLEGFKMPNDGFYPDHGLEPGQEWELPEAAVRQLLGMDDAAAYEGGGRGRFEQEEACGERRCVRVRFWAAGRGDVVQDGDLVHTTAKVRADVLRDLAGGHAPTFDITGTVDQTGSFTDGTGQAVEMHVHSDLRVSSTETLR